MEMNCQPQTARQKAKRHSEIRAAAKEESPYLLLSSQTAINVPSLLIPSTALLCPLEKFLLVFLYT